MFTIVGVHVSEIFTIGGLTVRSFVVATRLEVSVVHLNWVRVLRGDPRARFGGRLGVFNFCRVSYESGSIVLPLTRQLHTDG